MNKNRTPEEPVTELEQPWATPEPEPVALPVPEVVAEPAEMLTPQEWGVRLGLADKTDPARPWIETHADWRFAAADKLHGWTEHAHNYQAEADKLRITEADFQAALEAGAAYPAKPAHRAACGKGFEARAEVTDG